MIAENQELPRRFGRYVLQRELARGGMGAVYLASFTGRQGFDKLFAIKLIHPQYGAEPRYLELFAREARLCEQLDHPNVCQVFEYGEEAGSPYLVMEFLRGVPLVEPLRTASRARGVVPYEVTARVVADAARGLHAAHELLLPGGRHAEVVHRDVSPQNIFVLYSGVTKVVDFGVAHWRDPRADAGGSDAVVGKLAYMSPEQASGGPLDRRTDVFSLGVVLWELLVGARLFAGTSDGHTLSKLLREPIEAPKSRRAEVPDELSGLTLRALARDRAARVESAERFAIELERWLAKGASGSGATAVSEFLRRSGPPVEPTITLLRDEAVELEATRESSHGPGASPVPASTNSTAGASSLRAPEVRASEERRFAAVLCVRGARSTRELEALAAERGAAVEARADERFLVAFGRDRWRGDEPRLAARLAVLLRDRCVSAGLAFGATVRRAGALAGPAVDGALALAAEPGVFVDGAGARLLRASASLRYVAENRFELQNADDEAVPREERAERPLVGRDAEVAVLARSIEDAREERAPRCVVVVGAPGMGKSRLLREALVGAARAPEGGVEALAIHAESLRQNAPFSVLLDGLRRREPLAARALERATTSVEDPNGAFERAFALLAEQLRGMCSAGVLLLAVDDAQWLDGHSARALQRLSSALSELPVVLWMMVRPEGRSKVLELTGSATVLELRPLSRSASERLLCSMVGSAPPELLERAGGSPLFLEELARLVGADGAPSDALPPSVESASLAQLDALSEVEREYLKTASVFGRVAWCDAVAASDPSLTPAVFDALRAGQFLVARPSERLVGAREFGFRSAVLHEVAYGLWGESRRAEAHRRAGDWLATRAEVTPGELARHWEIAGDHARASAAYADEAERSVRSGSHPAEALALAERALLHGGEPHSRFRALAAKEWALSLTGEHERQRETLEEMERAAPSVGAAAEAQAACRAANSAMISGHHQTALDCGARALERASAAGALRWIAMAHNELALLHSNRRAIAPATEHAREGVRVAAAHDDPWLVARAEATRGFVLASFERHTGALGSFERASALFESAGDLRRAQQVRSNALGTCCELGRFEAASEWLGRVVGASRTSHGIPRAFALMQGVVLARMAHRVASPDGVELREIETIAEKFQHRRLLAAVAVERLYQVLADPDRQGARVERPWIEAQIALSRAASSDEDMLSAACAGSRVAAAAGHPGLASRMLSVATGASTAAGLGLRSVLELQATVWSAAPSDEPAKQAMRAAAIALVERNASPPDADPMLRSLERRYELPGGALTA